MKTQLLLVCFTVSLQLAFAQLPIGDAGWSEVAPSPDSRIIYVSSSEGNDANDGLSAATAVATVSRGAALARPGMPDHILFKTGDTFRTKFGLGNFHSGRSAAEPAVLSYYGEGSVRPVIDCENAFLSAFQVSRANIAVIGLDFYASNQDPDSEQFDPTVFHRNRVAFSLIGTSGGNLLIEDCKFRFIGLGAFTALNPGDLENIKIRRNIVVDAWADSTYFEHYSDGRNRQQGMYIEDTRGILIEENLFDHNGWNGQVPGAGKNKFNHNIYMQTNNPGSEGILVRGNILARASAHGLQLRSGGRVTDNLFLQNSVNVNVGYPPEGPADRSATGYVADNVFLEVVRMDSSEEVFNNPQRSGALWGVNTINLPSVVENNIFAHALNTETNVISVGNYDDRHNLGGALVERGNINYRWFDKTEAPDPEWFDPNRQLRDYSRRLGLQASAEAFLLAARERALRTWPEEYSAYAVNDYIRTGFATDLEDRVPPPAPDTAFVKNITGETAVVGWSWAEDDVRTVGYVLYVNGERFNVQPVTADTFLVSGLRSLTTYTVIVRTVDVGGNESVNAGTVTFTTLDADTVAPSSPALPTVLAKTESSIRLGWPPSTDNRSVLGYWVYLDGQSVNQNPIADTTFSVEDLEIATTYRFAVSAVDPAGNESAPSGVLQVKTLDPIDPSDPTNLEAVLVEAGTVLTSWSPATDNDTLAGYYIYVNYTGGDEPIAFTADTTATLEMSGPPPYEIRVAAVDVSGNRSRLTRPVLAEAGVSTFSVDATGLGLTLYPNPASHVLSVSMERGQFTRFTLHDLAGRMVASDRFGAMDRRQLDISAIPSGTYYLTLDLANGGKVSAKVEVVR